MGRAYEGIMQFAGCVQKICNMRYWSRETVRNAFYDDLENCVYTDFARFDPHPDLFPLADYPSGVDWTLRHDNRDFYVFGVRGNDKAKNVAISLLEFQKAQLQFISLVVHEDIEELGRRERLYITRNADTQYPVLRDFQEKSRRRHPQICWHGALNRTLVGGGTDRIGRPYPSAPGLAQASIGSPRRPATRLRAASFMVLRRVGRAALPMWGVMTRLSRVSSGSSGEMGSGEVTSRAAPGDLPVAQRFVQGCRVHHRPAGHV